LGVALSEFNTTGRPHRLACLLEGPDEPVPVSRELLEAFASLGLGSAGEQGSGGAEERGSRGARAAPHGHGVGNRKSSIANRQFSLDSWLAAHNVPVGEPSTWRGGRRWEFPVCPWDPSHLGSAYLVELPNGAVGAGCHHNSCAGKGWTELKQLYDCGLLIADLNASTPLALTGALSDVPGFQSIIVSPKSAIASWPIVKSPAERGEAEERALALVESCARLDRAEVLRVAGALRDRGLNAGFIRQWLSAVREAARRARAANAAPSPIEYEAEDGRIYRVIWEAPAGGEPRPRRSVVADFALTIVEEVTGEDGRVWFTLAGEGADGRPMRLELASAEFADDRMLQAAVTAAAGSHGAVRANMLRHLRPAIQLLTPDEVPQLRRYERTGWLEGSNVQTLERSNVQTSQPISLRFLIPGREPPGVVVRLPRKLPYRVGPDGDLPQGLAALEDALNAADSRRTTVLLAAMLGAPLARLAGLQGERYGVFLSGRTGSLKTSTAQVLMCIYGAGFIEDAYLLKLGEGATRNALMGYASYVHDLPLLVDNFKPGTGDGVRGFVNLLHNLLEGGDRERMTRTAELRETRPVHCWPVFTGEDVPDADIAGLARLLILPFEQLAPRFAGQPGDPAERGAGDLTARDAGADRLAALTRAQALSAHLPAVGEAWLAWLEGEGAAIAAEAGARFPVLRARWLEHLHEMHADMTNPLRVASSLACNELAWWVLLGHPQLGALADRFDETHAAGVYLAADEAGSRTTVSLEAARFLAVLRELLATGRCELVAKGGGRRPVSDDAASGSSLRWAAAAEDRYPYGTGSSADGRPGRGRNTPQGSDAGSPPERTLGWECPDGSIYLLPELARREVERVLGPGGLNGISSRTLHEQLSELGMIASRDPGRFTRRVREGGRLHNVLHLLPDALEG
jgi:hypothetical protein